ncbi:uncharacterized protein LOC113209204 [Frankliniella occidentalis]|uniref:Uncharacterized protein LOC113209204 n=1 Tax=Frankliniella occidentalis TaxID=133901 RepID=A0A6J1SSU4_FRAOC|nr:uncharacterized protein LOC113209204 [Frankliniella occidentalis]
MVHENRKETLASVPVKKAKTLGYNLKEKSNVRRGLLKSFNNCSSENDQVKSSRPKRKAAQSLRYDTADNESELSESRWDFSGSDFGDPTWGSGSKKSSESDEETGSDSST